MSTPSTTTLSSGSIQRNISYLLTYGKSRELSKTEIKIELLVVGSKLLLALGITMLIVEAGVLAGVISVPVVPVSIFLTVTSFTITSIAIGVILKKPKNLFKNQKELTVPTNQPLAIERVNATCWAIVAFQCLAQILSKERIDELPKKTHFNSLKDLLNQYYQEKAEGGYVFSKTSDHLAKAFYEIHKGECSVDSPQSTSVSQSSFSSYLRMGIEKIKKAVAYIFANKHEDVSEFLEPIFASFSPLFIDKSEENGDEDDGVLDQRGAIEMPFTQSLLEKVQPSNVKGGTNIFASLLEDNWTAKNINGGSWPPFLLPFRFYPADESSNFQILQQVNLSLVPYLYLQNGTPSLEEPVNSDGHEYHKYELTAIIEHSGKYINKGHYIIYLKKEDGWYCCDDRKIENCGVNIPTKKPYICLYRQMGD